MTELVLGHPDAFRRHGWWRDRLVTDDLDEWAQAEPERDAQVTYAAEGWVDRLTFGELAHAVDSIAVGLLELGVRPGDPVCFQLPNWWYFTAVHLACVRIGAVSCPMVPILRRREVEFMVGHVRARVLILPDRFRGRDYAEMGSDLLDALPTLEHVFVIQGPRGAGGSFEGHFLSRSEESIRDADLAARRPDPDAVTSIQFTSGTTGEPKGVMHTHNSLHATTRLVPWALGLTPSDIVVMPSPLAHASGFLYGTLMPVSFGMKCCYQDVWDADRMLEIVDAESATWTIGSPPFVMDTIESCTRQGRTAGTLKIFACAGAPIPRYLVRKAPEATGARLAAIWGLTETGAVTITPIDQLDRAEDSDGMPSPAMQVRIADDDGVDLPAGREGRLLVRGASKFVGYHERDDLTQAAVDADGWLDTGDVAAKDLEGFVTITGRVKDLVIRGGENIPVVEVEDALFQHPSIRDVAVIGVPDRRLGERACAVVVPEPGQRPDLASLAGHLESLGFAKQFWPERLELVAELPRTAAGKVQKFLLQEDLERDALERP